MANGFQFIGRISRKKENAFVEKTFNSGWLINELNFSMVCGDNVQYLKASGGMWDDAHSDKNSVITYKHNPNGKDEFTTIKWEDRNDSEIIETIANYKTYTVDTEIAADRKAAEDSKDAVAIEASNKKHKTFIAAIDFVRWLDKVTSNEKTKNWIWKVTGDVEYRYGGKDNKGNDVWYRNFVPRRVYHVDSETKQECSGTIKTYFLGNCVNENDEAYFFDVYTIYYDQMCKENRFTPMKLEIPKSHPKAKGFKMLYGKTEDEYAKELGVRVTYVNGAQKIEITEDMIKDEQREMLEWGMITMDDIRAEIGNSLYDGNKKTAIVIDDLAWGYTSGTKETKYEMEHLKKLPIKKEVVTEEEVKEEMDLFSGDDIDDEI